MTLKKFAAYSILMTMTSIYMFVKVGSQLGKDRFYILTKGMLQRIINKEPPCVS